MIAKRNNNAVEISFTYDPALVSFVKALAGRKYNPATKSWFIPLAGSHDVLERLAKRGFSIETTLWDQVRRDQEQAREAEALAVMPDAEFTSPLPLFPYQKVGSAFLYKIGSGLIGDEPGLGKTIMALAVCEKVKAEKVLVFCPAAVKWQWAEEIAKFIPTAQGRVRVIEGNKEARQALWQDQGGRFYIANYELLLRDFESLNQREWDIIIADEATKISNPQAKQSKAIKRLRARRKIAMTGTPVSNRANEVWNIIDFTNPGAFGNYWAFLQRYCLKNQWGGIFGYQHMDELRGRLKRYMIRRLMRDVLPELPAKIITDIPFELTEEEKVLYKRLKKEILFEIEHRDIAKLETPMTIQHTLVKMLRLRQLADSMELLGHNTKSSKLETLKEILTVLLVWRKSRIKNMKEKEKTSSSSVFPVTNYMTRKVIVFSQFAEMCKILYRELKQWDPLLITGETPKEERVNSIKLFNEDEVHKILICSDAMQYGVNLQRASAIVHYDQQWSLAKMQQREGRAHRYGQKDTVLIYNLLAKGTLDYYVKKVLHAKAELSDQLLGDTPISMAQIKDILTYE